MTRALVTGSAGFIGSHVTESLLEDGWEVTGVDCFNDNYGRREKLRNLEHAQSWERFDFVPIDLARGDLYELVIVCALVCHLAAEPGVRGSWGDRFDHYVRNNVLATQHLLEALKQCPGTRLVYASSSSVYGNAERLPTREDVLPSPFSPYGVTKLAAEHLCDMYCANWGVPVVTLRYFSVFGPRQRPDMAFHRFCRAAIEREEIVVFGDGEQSRDFTYVADIVTATRTAASEFVPTRSTYNVGGGSRRTVNEALALIGELAGARPKVRYLAHERGDVRDSGADIAAAARELHYVPATSFEDGLRAEFEWIVERSKTPRPV